MRQMNVILNYRKKSFLYFRLNTSYYSHRFAFIDPVKVSISNLLKPGNILWHIRITNFIHPHKHSFTSANAQYSHIRTSLNNDVLMMI